MLEKYSFDTNKKGKKILILGAVHGNEVAGKIASQNVIKMIEDNKIELQSGKITFVPICNPKAHENDVREIDVNLNRVIKKHNNPKLYEEFLANEIAELIEENDILIDFHSTSSVTDKPFCFLDHPSSEAEKLISNLGIDLVLKGWPEIYSDSEIEDFSTEKYAYMCNKLSLTVECGYHKSKASIEFAQKTILSLLSYYNLIDGDNSKSSPQMVDMKKFYIKEFEGAFAKDFSNMDRVREGEVITIYENGEKIIMPYDGYIIMPKKNAKIGTEWFYIAV